MVNDLVVQFARLWGQREALVVNSKDEDVADMLKTYDSEELQRLLQTWADEFSANKENEDTVDFFEQKIEVLCAAHLDWSIEVYSIKDSKDLLILQIDEEALEENIPGGYFGYRISFDKIEEGLRDLCDDFSGVETSKITEEIIDAAVINDYYFSPDKTTGIVYLKDIVKETGITLQDYLCGYDSSYFNQAVIHGLSVINEINSLDETLANAKERSAADVNKESGVLKNNVEKRME